MEYGESVTDLLEDEFSWEDLASCSDNTTMTLEASMRKTNLFFDKYESSVSVALNIENLCIRSCPVATECLKKGMDTGSWGVWGGVYLVYGKPDKNKNSHKNEDTWGELTALHGFDPREHQQDS